MLLHSHYWYSGLWLVGRLVLNEIYPLLMGWLYVAFYTVLWVTVKSIICLKYYLGNIRWISLHSSADIHGET